MLDPKEIDIEIAKWEYLESSYDNYAKLANLYTIRDHMNKVTGQSPIYNQSYFAAPADYTLATELYGDSDFLRAVEGKDPAEAWSIIDDLMDTLHTVNPRVYDGVMRKIKAL